MKKMFVLLSCISLSLVMFTACGVNDNDRPQIYRNNLGNDPLINNRGNDGDSPLRNDPEYNDPDNNIFDADRDDRFIDDEDIRLAPNNNRR